VPKRSQPQEKATPAQPTKPATVADVDALEVMMIQATMQRQFMRVILRRLTSDVPEFQSQMFLAELQLIMESLESSNDKSVLHTFALKEWARLSEMALGAVASTRPPQGKH
jgi:hypothetical protein